MRIEFDTLKRASHLKRLLSNKKATPLYYRRMILIMKINELGFVLSIAAVFLLASCASHNSTSSRVSDQSKDNIRTVLLSYVAAREARDIDAVKDVLDPDVDQLTSRGEWRRGLEAATAGMKRSSKMNPGKRSLEVVSVRFLSPDVALADARYTIKGTEGPDRILWSSFTLVKNSDGKWLITSIRNQKPTN